MPGAELSAQERESHGPDSCAVNSLAEKQINSEQTNKKVTEGDKWYPAKAQLMGLEGHGSYFQHRDTK